ncbi:MAG: transglutaminase family protein [Phycisphaerales bacterium]|nr:transglutaminase family protein [Phycisphaerales bacterium]
MQRVLAMVGLVLAFATVATADTRWYVVKLQDQPAGWMSIERREAGGFVTTITTMRVAVGRQGSIVVTAFESEVVEFDHGAPHSMRRRIEGDRDEETSWRFNGRSVTVEREGGQAIEPAPDGIAIGPDAERRQLSERMAAGDETIDTQVVDPLSGLDPVPTRRTRVGTSSIEIIGKPIEVVRFETRRGDEDRVVQEWLDAEGHLVRAVTAIGAVTQEIVLSDETNARRALSRPPDLIDATRVESSRAIRGHERIRTAIFVIRGNDEIPVVSTGPQVAERADAQAVRFVIDLDRPGPVVELTADETAELLASTDLLESDDAMVAELTDRATRSLPARASDGLRAEAMRGFVHRFISRKTLDVALGTAAETARSREGDCTEHAALLAAMLRAGGIPSRLVAGLTYEPGGPGTEPAFIYHVWAQALIESDGGLRWIDLDATQRRRARHAAQIALSVSDGSNANDLWAGLAPTLGTISIDVEATR